MIENTEKKNRRKFKELQASEKKSSLYNYLRKPVTELIKENVDPELFEVMTDPFSRLYDVYLHLLSKRDGLRDKTDYITLLQTVEFFRQQLYDLLPPAIKSDRVKTIHILFEVKGPRLTGRYNPVDRSESILGSIGNQTFFPSSQQEHNDLTEQFDHPYIKLSKKRVIHNDDCLFKRVFSFDLNQGPEEIIDEVNSWLETVLVFPGEEILFTIEIDLVDEFKTWCDLRREELITEQQLKQILPLITNDDFLERMDKWEKLGVQLVDNIERIKESLLMVIGSGKYDLQIVKGILTEASNKNNQSEFSREEVLDLWVQKERRIGNKKSDNYLRDHLLRPRLTSVIEFLENSPDPELSIRKPPSERGRPKTILCLNIPKSEENLHK